MNNSFRWHKMVHRLCIIRADKYCELCDGRDKKKKKSHVNGFGLCGHHILPRSQGGTDSPGNALMLCSACHSSFHSVGKGRDNTFNPISKSIIKNARKRIKKLEAMVRNNDIANLELMARSEHTKQHNLQRRLAHVHQTRKDT